MADTHPDFPRPGRRRRPGWTGWRITSVVAGSVLALVSLGVLAAGGVALWADATQRQDGYLSVTTGDVHTAGYALTSGTLTLEAGTQWVARSVIGTVRIQATPIGRITPVFVGVAPAGAVAAYLRGVRYATVTSVSGGRAGYRLHPGAASPADPRAAGIWVAKASGAGTQTVTWSARTGQWTAVVMNAGGAAGVRVEVVAGVSAPALAPVAAGLLAGGSALMLGAVMLIVLPVLRAGRGSAGGPPDGPAGWPPAGGSAGRPPAGGSAGW